MGVSLYGLAMDKYKTVTSFANAIGWGRQKASRILNGQRKPTIDDMEQIAAVLHIEDMASFLQIFFPRYATK